MNLENKLFNIAKNEREFLVENQKNILTQILTHGFFYVELPLNLSILPKEYLKIVTQM